MAARPSGRGLVGRTESREMKKNRERMLTFSMYDSNFDICFGKDKT